jgi:hypothetical protein
MTGTYVFRLTATDEASLSASDQVTVFAANEGTAVLRRSVSVGYDDAEEGQNLKVALGGSDLELVNDGATLGNQTVGVRFQNITVPRSTDVTNAYIQFQADRVTTGTTNLLVQAQAADNAPRFTTANGNISTRPRLGGVTWGPVPPWNTPGAATETERTPDIEPLVQALVNRTNWRSGNAMVFVITGTGKRAAESFNGQAAPILQIEYADGSGNEPPTVNAGPDRQVTLPNGLTLNGSVSDDGKPIPPGAFTSQWTQVDGPQSVVFSNETSPVTDVEFSESGMYTLRLTATDGIEVTTDDVTVVVASNTNTGVLNLVTNPTFETGTTGWNNASGAGIVLDRASPGHSGSFAARLTNNNGAAAECKLNDIPDTVTNATAGTYTASLWAQGATGATLRFRIREYLANGSTNVLIQNLTLSSTEWRQVTVSKSVSAGSKIDLQAWIASAPTGVCFLADDVILTRT